MGDFGSYLEENVVLHLPRGALSAFARHCERMDTICAVRKDLWCLSLSRFSSEVDSSADGLIWAGAREAELRRSKKPR